MPHLHALWLTGSPLVSTPADGTLLEHVQRHKFLAEPQARWLFQQLILAVDYCHKMGVSNRDIKLDNILLDKSTKGRPDWPIMKICDWGYARTGATSEACSKVVSVTLSGPCMLPRQGTSCHQSTAAAVGMNAMQHMPDLVFIGVFV